MGSHDYYFSLLQLFSKENRFIYMANQGCYGMRDYKYLLTIAMIALTNLHICLKKVEITLSKSSFEAEEAVELLIEEDTFDLRKPLEDPEF